MKIFNFEKLSGHNIVVLTGRNENVRSVAKELNARLYYCPRDTDYFKDYPNVAEELKESLMHKQGIVAITTQSSEFLDCLLESDIEFTLAIIRKYKDDEYDYRLNVMSKATAYEYRMEFDMELRS